MSKTIFQSAFSEAMYQYLDYRVVSGYKEISYRSHLRQFDQFCIKHGIIQPSFTKEHAEKWIKRKENEASTTHYSRINSIKQFLIYLSRKRYEVFVTRDINFKQTDFQPHIYTEDEIIRYFHAVDTYESSQNRKNAIQFPILFRLLYCCGTRINETLGIRKQDIDLENGIIKLIETKNNCERYIFLGDDFKVLIKKFTEKCFYLLNDGDYVEELVVIQFTRSIGYSLSKLEFFILEEEKDLESMTGGIPWLYAPSNR